MWLTNGASRWSAGPLGVFAVKNGFFCVLPVTGLLYVPAFIAMPSDFDPLVAPRQCVPLVYEGRRSAIALSRQRASFTGLQHRREIAKRKPCKLRNVSL